jgi:hypothetical protein
MNEGAFAKLDATPIPDLGGKSICTMNANGRIF